MGDNRFVIDRDGTITRMTSDLDFRMLNIIRIGAAKNNLLAAYKARKKCYKICKKLLDRDDYEEYVDSFLLDHNPNEFSKAEFGRQYHIWLCIIISSLLLACCGFYIADNYYNSTDEWLILIPITIVITLLLLGIYKCRKLSKKYKKTLHMISGTGIDIYEFLIIIIIIVLIMRKLFLRSRKDRVTMFRQNYIKANKDKYKNISNSHSMPNSQSIKQFEIRNDGTIICDSYNEDNTDETILLIPNIYNIIDTHISTRDKHIGQIVSTSFLDKHCQLLSNSHTDLMLDMLFETGNLKEQLELERFKGSRYYSFFANDSNCSYTLALNTGKKVIIQILVDIMINVYDHPKGKFLDSSTEII